MNFLELIRVPFEDYMLGGDACEYLNFHGFPQRRLAELREQIGKLLVLEHPELPLHNNRNASGLAFGTA